jgi:hypothetical protein
MSFIKCEICGDLATWYNMIYPDDAVGIARCNVHLPLNCICDDCNKFIDCDETGKRTEPCMNQSWEYNKNGWRHPDDDKYCVVPII